MPRPFVSFRMSSWISPEPRRALYKRVAHPKARRLTRLRPSRLGLLLRAEEESLHVQAFGDLRRVEEDAESELRCARVRNAVALGAVDEDAFELLRRAVGVNLRARQQRARNPRAPERERAPAARSRFITAPLDAPVRRDFQRERVVGFDRSHVFAGIVRGARPLGRLAPNLLDVLHAHAALLVHRVLALAESRRKLGGALSRVRLSGGVRSDGAQADEQCRG